MADEEFNEIPEFVRNHIKQNQSDFEDSVNSLREWSYSKELVFDLRNLINKQKQKWIDLSNMPIPTLEYTESGEPKIIFKSFHHEQLQHLRKDQSAS